MPHVSSVREKSDTVKRQVMDWWETNPMVYDWQRSMRLPAGSKEFYEEIDRRLWAAAPFARSSNGTPFGRLMEHDKWNGKRVLEIGCGSGAHTAQLIRAGASTTAVDLTMKSVRLTKRRLDLYGLKAEVLQSDAERLPFGSGRFDLVWSWGVLHHTPRTGQAISEIHRVLKPGGEARLMVYHRDSVVYWINMMLLRGMLGGGLTRMSPSQLANKHSDGEIAQYFSRRGFRDLMGDFSSAKYRVFSQPTDVYPLPHWLRTHVIRLVPSAITNSPGATVGRFPLRSGHQVNSYWAHP